MSMNTSWLSVVDSGFFATLATRLVVICDARHFPAIIIISVFCVPGVVGRSDVGGVTFVVECLIVLDLVNDRGAVAPIIVGLFEKVSAARDVEVVVKLHICLA